MTETPITRLIPRLAVPTIISMLVTMLYNIADTFFVSQISVAASGATGVLLSLMGLIQAFGFMFGQGAGSIIARALFTGLPEAVREMKELLVRARRDLLLSSERA